MGVGQGLMSCTTEVASTTPFLIDNCNVILIDTPGFDNNIGKDLRDIIEEVETHLKNRYVPTFPNPLSDLSIQACQENRELDHLYTCN
jgi:hypothetical protein